MSWSLKNPKLGNQSPKPNSCSLSRTPCQAPRAYLIHHQVVVTLVPIAVLQGERNPEGLSQDREMLNQSLCSAQDPREQRDPFSPVHPSMDQHQPRPAGSHPDLGLGGPPWDSSFGLFLFPGPQPSAAGQGRAGQTPPPSHSPWCTHRMPRQLLLLPLPLQPRPLLVLQALGRGGGNTLRERGTGRCVSHPGDSQPPPPLSEASMTTSIRAKHLPGWWEGPQNQVRNIPSTTTERSTPAETTSQGGAENPHWSGVYFTSTLQ